MLIPRRGNEFDFFNDMFMGDSFFDRGSTRLMRTDIREREDNYLIEVDLPGYEKENIEIEIENGYLKITAKTSQNQKDENEKFVHQERFYGECSRSFYIGNQVTEKDIKANFKNGILTLIVPKNISKTLENKKLITIEG